MKLPTLVATGVAWKIDGVSSPPRSSQFHNPFHFSCAAIALAHESRTLQ